HSNLGVRFAAVAAGHGRRPALCFGPGDVRTHADLDALANRTARVLLTRGVRRGDMVCVSGQKSAVTFACMLACLKVGAVYSILDPDSPVERLRKVLSACQPTLLFAEHDMVGRLADLLAEVGVAVV